MSESEEAKSLRPAGLGLPSMRGGVVPLRHGRLQVVSMIQ